jgi:hypothetical protein
MESCEDLKERARRSIQVAEHMLIKTYPVVDDPKLILAVAGDIYTALTSSMEALLISKKEENQLEFSNDFSSRFSAFKGIANDHGFSEEDLAMIEELDRIMEEHRESPVEFARKDKFVICDEKYNLEAISLDDMKSYLFKARLFIEKAETIMNSKEIQDKHE